MEDLEAGNEALKEAVKAAANESSKAVERVISERLRQASEERAALAAFREVLSEVAPVNPLAVPLAASNYRVAVSSIDPQRKSRLTNS